MSEIVTRLLESGEESEDTKTKKALALLCERLLGVLEGDEDYDDRQVNTLRHYSATDNLYHMSDEDCAKIIDDVKTLEMGYKAWNRVRQKFLDTWGAG